MDKEWTEEIDEKISFMSKDLNIKIKRFNIEERVEVKNKFWGGIDSLMLTKFHKEEYYFAKQQVKRLSSYKHTQGWFALNKGPTTVVVGSRATFSKAVAEFHMWKVSVRQRTFEVAFKEYHEKLCKSLNSTHELSSIACCSSMRATTIQKSFGNCCTIESVLTATGEYPEKISCPVCDQVMEITVTYKCNHTSKDDFHC
uniref:Sieve element occlusion C-terminal domain-containing protein n=2 Tax=Cannabis sativa TaxID=3483 RepID=A0A803R896_CANSA